jgi:hypothetical protein
MPAFGIVSDIVSGAVEAQEGEGFLCEVYGGDRDGMDNMETEMVMMVSVLLVMIVNTDDCRRISASPYSGLNSKAKPFHRGQPTGMS